MNLQNSVLSSEQLSGYMSPNNIEPIYQKLPKRTKSKTRTNKHKEREVDVSPFKIQIKRFPEVRKVQESIEQNSHKESTHQAFFPSRRTPHQRNTNTACAVTNLDPASIRRKKNKHHHLNHPPKRIANLKLHPPQENTKNIKDTGGLKQSISQIISTPGVPSPNIPKYKALQKSFTVRTPVQNIREKNSNQLNISNDQLHKKSLFENRGKGQSLSEMKYTKLSHLKKISNGDQQQPNLVEVKNPKDVMAMEMAQKNFRVPFVSCRSNSQEHPERAEFMIDNSWGTARDPVLANKIRGKNLSELLKEAENIKLGFNKDNEIIRNISPSKSKSPENHGQKLNKVNIYFKHPVIKTSTQNTSSQEKLLNPTDFYTIDNLPQTKIQRLSQLHHSNDFSASPIEGREKHQKQNSHLAIPSSSQNNAQKNWKSYESSKPALKRQTQEFSNQNETQTKSQRPQTSFIIRKKQKTIAGSSQNKIRINQHKDLSTKDPSNMKLSVVTPSMGIHTNNLSLVGPSTNTNTNITERMPHDDIVIGSSITPQNNSFVPEGIQMKISKKGKEYGKSQSASPEKQQIKNSDNMLSEERDPKKVKSSVLNINEQFRYERPVTTNSARRDVFSCIPTRLLRKENQDGISLEKITIRPQTTRRAHSSVRYRPSPLPVSKNGRAASSRKYRTRNKNQSTLDNIPTSSFQAVDEQLNRSTESNQKRNESPIEFEKKGKNSRNKSKIFNVEISMKSGKIRGTIYRRDDKQQYFYTSHDNNFLTDHSIYHHSNPSQESFFEFKELNDQLMMRGSLFESSDATEKTNHHHHSRISSNSDWIQKSQKFLMHNSLDNPQESNPQQDQNQSNYIFQKEFESINPKNSSFHNISTDTNIKPKISPQVNSNQSYIQVCASINPRIIYRTSAASGSIGINTSADTKEVDTTIEEKEENMNSNFSLQSKKYIEKIRKIYAKNLGQYMKAHKNDEDLIKTNARRSEKIKKYLEKILHFEDEESAKSQKKYFENEILHRKLGHENYIPNHPIETRNNQSAEEPSTSISLNGHQSHSRSYCASKMKKRPKTNSISPGKQLKREIILANKVEMFDYSVLDPSKLFKLKDKKIFQQQPKKSYPIKKSPKIQNENHKIVYSIGNEINLKAQENLKYHWIKQINKFSNNIITPYKPSQIFGSQYKKEKINLLSSNFQSSNQKKIDGKNKNE